MTCTVIEDDNPSVTTASDTLWIVGNAHCKVCHYDKFPKRGLTDQEVKSDVSYKEQVKEYRLLPEKEKHDIRERNSDAAGTV